MDPERLVESLSTHLPPVMRWAGSVARRMRHFDIALEGKHSGSASTDALTLADLTVQELLVAALRDCDPLFRQCRLEAEESTGDLTRFAQTGEYTLALDPIDGTKRYRDRSGNGYSIILTLRSPETVHYSLVFVPESCTDGSWVEVAHDRIACGADDPSRPATDVLHSLHSFARSSAGAAATFGSEAVSGESVRPHLRPFVAGSPGATRPPRSAKRIYVIGFQQQDRAKADLVSQSGLNGIAAEDCPGCLYELMARGEYAGSLTHSPNVYDYPAGLHLARVMGGDSLWVHNRQPVDFRELWTDERANMLRLPGIIATSPDRGVLDTLCTLARDWNPVRYAE